MNYSFIIIIIVMIGMWYFMNRQQKKAQAERQEQLNTMQVGTEIVTIGGLHGKLHSIDTEKNLIELDCEGVILTFERSAIKSIVPSASTTVVQETAESPIEEKGNKEN
ncbi:MAG: preprotein translocase subunit YajC [Streptococcaceae bacterium]|nr:preprotein translocase subunit YajC [Streptococcaceae bacterium]MCL2858677.1 preprotein translocase subunit YajC [Streptococcaceae bacterium]